MKRSIVFFVLLFYIFSFQPTTLAAGFSSASDHSVYDAIHNGADKTPSPPPTKGVDSASSSIFPLLLKFIFSFILIIALLFVLLRFLSKRNRLLQSNGPVISLGSTMLGNNRSLQVLLIGQTIYIVGVGETVSLIRTISHGEEYQHLLESFENQPEGFSPTWDLKETGKIWSSIFQKQMQKMRHKNEEE